MPISFSHWQTRWGECWQTTSHSINELTDHTGVQCDSRASRAWGVTGRLNTLLLISRIIEWRLRFSSDLYCWLRKRNLNGRVKLSAVTLSNLQCPSSFHRPGQHCFVAGNPHVRWLAGAAMSAILWSENMTFCSYAAHCIVWQPHLPFCPPEAECYW